MTPSVTNIEHLTNKELSDLRKLMMEELAAETAKISTTIVGNSDVWKETLEALQYYRWSLAKISKEEAKRL